MRSRNCRWLGRVLPVPLRSGVGWHRSVRASAGRAGPTATSPPPCGRWTVAATSPVSRSRRVTKPPCRSQPATQTPPSPTAMPVTPKPGFPTATARPTPPRCEGLSGLPFSLGPTWPQLVPPTTTRVARNPATRKAPTSEVRSGCLPESRGLTVPHQPAAGLSKPARGYAVWVPNGQVYWKWEGEDEGGDPVGPVLVIIRLRKGKTPKQSNGIDGHRGPRQPNSRASTATSSLLTSRR